MHLDVLPILICWCNATSYCLFDILADARLSHAQDPYQSMTSSPKITASSMNTKLAKVNVYVDIMFQTQAIEPVAMCGQSV